MTEEKFDVFLSHAFEDKNFTDPLAKSLIEAGVSVWYSGFELKVGDSIMDSVNEGIRNSNYGIAVLSPSYFFKKWTRAEINSIFAMETEEGKKVLPILHKVSINDVAQNFSIMADRFALSSEIGIVQLVQKIVQVVKKLRTPYETTPSFEIKINMKADLHKKLQLDQILQAIESLLIYLQDKPLLQEEHTTLLIQSSKYHNTKRAYMDDRLSHNEYMRELAKINYVLKQIIDEVF